MITSKAILLNFYAEESWTNNGHVVRLNYRAGTKGMPMYFLKCDRHWSLEAPEMGTGCRMTGITCVLSVLAETESTCPQQLTELSTGVDGRRRAHIVTAAEPTGRDHVSCCLLIQLITL